MSNEGFHKNVSFIFNRIIKDETLMRLLYYPPVNSIISKPHTNEFNSQGKVIETLDPLDVKHPNIVPSNPSDFTDPITKKYWELVETLVLPMNKSNNIEEKGICRLHIYNSDSTPIYGVETVLRNDIINIDILTEDRYEGKDSRSGLIIDRIYYLLNRRIGVGIKRMKVRNPLSMQTVNQYTKYRVLVEVMNHSL